MVEIWQRNQQPKNGEYFLTRIHPTLYKDVEVDNIHLSGPKVDILERLSTYQGDSYINDDNNWEIEVYRVNGNEKRLILRTTDNIYRKALDQMIELLELGIPDEHVEIVVID